MNKTIDSSFTGKKYGNIFKEIKKNQIVIPKKMFDIIISNLPSKESIDKFKNFILNMVAIYYLR